MSRSWPISSRSSRRARSARSSPTRPSACWTAVRARSASSAIREKHPLPSDDLAPAAIRLVVRADAVKGTTVIDPATRLIIERSDRINEPLDPWRTSRTASCVATVPSIGVESMICCVVPSAT
jgi:hypothetical protein